MSYQPKPGDMATDLLRSFSASQSKEGFESNNFKLFYNHALKIFPRISDELSDSKREIIIKCLRKVASKKIDENKKKEDLLLAATLLLH